MTDNVALLLQNKIICDRDDWENYKPLKRPRKSSKSSMTTLPNGSPNVNIIDAGVKSKNAVRHAKKTVPIRKRQSKRPRASNDKADDLNAVFSNKPKSSNKSQTSNEADKALGLPTSDDQISELFCPSCQLPFSLLLIQSSNWHLTECFQLDRTKLEECPRGVGCDSTMASHYSRYNHYNLAHWRATGQVLQQRGCENSVLNTSLSLSNEHIETDGQVPLQPSAASPLTKDSNKSPIAEEISKTQDLPSNSVTTQKRDSVETSLTLTQVLMPRLDRAISPKKRKTASTSTEIQKDIRSFFASPERPKPSVAEKCSTVETKSQVNHPHGSGPSQEWSVRWWEKKPLAGKLVEPPTNLKANQTKRKASGMFAFHSSDNSYTPDSEKTAARQCPFYKKISGTSFTVDAFSYGTIPGVTAYFLSHFHADHYQGLTRRFSMPLYCNKITANLVKLQIKVDAKYVNILPMNEPVNIQGVEVTLLEANHCPGSAMFLFRLANGRIYLHTGDFRAHTCMESYPALAQISVDILYLDTTYCNPRYDFAPQEETVNFAVALAKAYILRDPKTLVVCGSYTIGKEKIFLAIAKELQTKVCVLPPKLRILNCLEDTTISGIITCKGQEAAVHVLPMMKLGFQALEAHLNGFHGHFTKVLAIKPTGWEHRGGAKKPLSDIKPRVSNSGLISIYGIPYSEHSSYYEMQRFVQFLRPKSILPTVNVGKPQERAKMQAIFSSWLVSGS